MKLVFALFCTLFLSTGFPADQANLTAVRTVYFLPMGSGFDQYMANQLTMHGVFQVVTDATLADAIFTDQIGTKFERQLEVLYPPPPAPEEEKSAEGDETGPAEDKSEEDEVSEPERPPLSTFSRAKGNLFLVGRQSRAVIWSFYVRPKNTGSDEMIKAADKVVMRLRDAMGLVN